jgi:parvulin-like peptidyl-prolyl isomerase
MIAGWLVVAMLAGGVAAAERTVVEGVMIRVNDRVVTISEFEHRVEQEMSQIPEEMIRGKEADFAERMLNEMVAELVLMERAEEKRLTIDDSTVDKAVENIREENNLQDDAAWEQALAASGLTLEVLRERYRRTMLMQRAVQGEVRPVDITEEELRLDYEEHKERYRVPAKVELEQVFLEDQRLGDGEALKVAAGLVERVRAGADLKAEAILAGSELQDQGAIPVEDCRQDLRSALEGLEAGGITDPLTVSGGVQVVRLVGRIDAGYEPFEDVVEQLRRERSASSYEEQTRGLVEKLREEYLVEVHEDYLDQVLERLGGA